MVFNPRPGAITDHSQSVTDTDPFFKSQLHVEDPSHRKPVVILSNGWSKPGERASVTEIVFLQSVGFEPTTS